MTRFDSLAILLLAGCSNALTIDTPAGKGVGGALIAGETVKVAWTQPIGYNKATISLFSGPAVGLNDAAFWSHDLMDLQAGVDLSTISSLQWTVPAVVPCAPIFYLSVYSLGQPLKQSGKFSICQDATATPDANNPGGTGWLPEGASAGSVQAGGGNQQGDDQQGNGQDSGQPNKSEDHSIEMSSGVSSMSTGVNTGKGGEQLNHKANSTEEASESAFDSTTTIIVTSTSSNGSDEEEPESTGSLDSTDVDKVADSSDDSGQLADETGSDQDDGSTSDTTTDDSSALSLSCRTAWLALLVVGMLMLLQ